MRPTVPAENSRPGEMPGDGVGRAGSASAWRRAAPLVLVLPGATLILAGGLAGCGLTGPRLWRILDGVFFVAGSLVFLAGALFAKPEPFTDGAPVRPRIGCPGEAAPPALADPDAEAEAIGALKGRLREHAGRLMLGGLGLLAWTLVLDRIRNALR